MALEFTDSNFEEQVLKSDKPVLVDFWAPWCGPCRQMGPVLEKLSEKIDVVKINTDEETDLAGSFAAANLGHAHPEVNAAIKAGQHRPSRLLSSGENR